MSSCPSADGPSSVSWREAYPCTFIGDFSILKNDLFSKAIARPLPPRYASLRGPHLLPTRVAYSSCVARYSRSCSSLLWLDRSVQTILNRLYLSNPEGAALFMLREFWHAFGYVPTDGLRIVWTVGDAGPYGWTAYISEDRRGRRSLQTDGLHVRGPSGTPFWSSSCQMGDTRARDRRGCGRIFHLSPRHRGAGESSISRHDTGGRVI